MRRITIGRLLFVPICILWSGSSFATYVVDGKIEGNVCTSYILFETCHYVDIDAVKGTDGKLYMAM
jgi:hypothetical protein